MELYISYGMVSAVMLLITIIFYSYKNWLALRKNALYLCILSLALTAAVMDIMAGLVYRYRSQYFAQVEEITGMVMSVCLIVLYMHIFLYDMAVTKRMRMTRTVFYRIFLTVTVLLGIVSIVAPFFGFSDFFNRNGGDGRGNLLQSAVMMICLVAGILTLLRNRQELTKREVYVLVGTQLLLLFDVNVQIVIQARNLASYYTLAAVLISYYILLHNLDQYRSFSSACFDRDGFYMVVQERAHYKENFTCMGICINNIESITNYCNENEINRLHHLMGKILRNNCGRHNVFHIHSFEYMIVLHGTESAEKKHRLLEQAIPPYFRINSKNVSLLCGFYTVEFADAGYDTTEFFRTITSMRKLTMEQMSRTHLLYYQGENQIGIRNELQSLRAVNQCIAKRSFGFQFIPIQSVADKNDVSYEFILTEELENGVVLSQEQIWDFATESGYIREVGAITLELFCKAAWEEGYLQDEHYKFHLNLLSSQLANTTLTEGYIQILKSHSVSGSRICIELTIDRSINYDKLLDSFRLLKDYGISILLDQFGVTVCNLKKILNMPFDSVKINHHMVRIFCTGKSSQLTYMVHMLNEQGWKIYIDGIDENNQLEHLEGMKFDYVQGQAVQPEVVRSPRPAVKTASAPVGEERHRMSSIQFSLNNSRGGMLVNE